MSLWTPPKVADDLREARAEREFIARNAMIRDESPLACDISRELDELVEGMKLIFCPDPSPVELVAIGGKPGHWAVYIPGQHGGPASITALVGPDGGCVEIGWWIVNKMKEQDWQNPAVMRERKREEDRRLAAKEQAEADQHEEANTEVLERYLAGTRASVSMNSDTPWSQNHAGKRGARK